MIQQPLLAPLTAAVPGQLSIAADDSMAGDDYPQAVVAICPADGAMCIGFPKSLRLITVGARFAVWDLAEPFPARPLEVGARTREG